MARKIALSLGLFVAFLPYLGFPEALDTVLYTLAGLVIAFLAWSGKRPVVSSSIEEMEGELQNAAEEDTLHAPKVPAFHTKEKVDRILEAEKSEEHSPNEGDSKNEPLLSKDTLVPVSFTKHRSHNLKKRITQEGPQLPT